MEEIRQERGIPASSEVEQLRIRASEAVTEANVDPSKLTPEEHHQVDLLHAKALRVATEANVAVLLVGSSSI